MIKAISLNEITDNSGIPTLVFNNVSLGAGKFAVIAKDSATLQALSLPSGTLQIVLSTPIGNGLSGSGDKLILKNMSQTVVDQLSWGSDSSIFTLGVIPAGHSLGRKQVNGDSDTASDFVDYSVGNPGS